MTQTTDNQLAILASGQADWDSDVDSNFGILERGYHTSARAGLAINSGYVCWMTSGGFFVPFDPNSLTIKPTAFCFTAPASGDSALFLLTGIVRSLYTAFVPGQDYFVSAVTLGLVVGSYSAASRKVGIGLDGGGIYFSPRHTLPEQLTTVQTVVINPATEHLFSVDIGKSGVVRDLLMKSNSMDKIGLAFYSNSARDNLLYQTKSGGVTTVASFVDRALWPYDNTDANTLSGIVYGSVWADSGASVASMALQIALVADRVK